MPFFGAAFVAFAVAVWQGVTLDGIFFDWTFSNIQHATILGVDIPFEVGENAAKLTFAMFFGLIVAWTGIGMIFTLFRSRKLRRVQRVVLLATIIAFAWLGWSAFSGAVPYWQRLF